MECKIREIFEYNGEWYQCVKSDNTCNGCVGQFQPYSFCSGFKECVGKIFKKLEKVGEPFERNGHLYQEYKTYAYPLLMSGDAKIPTANGFAVIIKQNKEYMSNTETLWYGPDKKEAKSLKLSNLKPFSLEAAKQGKPVCTRDGRMARIICFDAKRKDEKSIIALVPSKDYPGFEDLIAYPNNGNYYGGHENDGDLMMLPEKKEGWVNVYKHNLYDTESEAKRAHVEEGYVSTIKIEWEE